MRQCDPQHSSPTQEQHQHFAKTHMTQLYKITPIINCSLHNDGRHDIISTHHSCFMPIKHQLALRHVSHPRCQLITRKAQDRILQFTKHGPSARAPCTSSAECASKAPATRTHWAQYRQWTTQSTRTEGTRCVFGRCRAAAGRGCLRASDNKGRDAM